MQCVHYILGVNKNVWTWGKCGVEGSNQAICQSIIGAVTLWNLLQPSGWCVMIIEIMRMRMKMMMIAIIQVQVGNKYMSGDGFIFSLTLTLSNHFRHCTCCCLFHTSVSWPKSFLCKQNDNLTYVDLCMSPIISRCGWSREDLLMVPRWGWRWSDPGPCSLEPGRPGGLWCGGPE